MKPDAYRVEYLAARLQRLSGVLLALFLPLHFLVLSQALRGAEQLDQVLSWTANPMVKIGESVLVILLTFHLLGGLRILLIELVSWGAWQKTMASVAGGVAFAAALLFLLRAF